jgi:NDP-mannose synthase
VSAFPEETRDRATVPEAQRPQLRRAQRDHDSLVGTSAVILAGGRGTRLAPYTSILPKPLMPVGDRSILEIVLDQLATSGVTRITLSVGYLSHLIRAVLNGHWEERVQLEYVHEAEPLGTAAPLKLVSGLDDTFIVMNGDVLTALDPRDLVREHWKTGSLLTIATHERRVKIDYGIIHRDETNRIIAFEEKPEISAQVSMGVYVMEPEVLDFVSDEHMDFPELVQALLEAGLPVSSYPYDGLWFDLGRQDDFQTAVTAWMGRSDEAERNLAQDLAQAAESAREGVSG